MIKRLILVSFLLMFCVFTSSASLDISWLEGEEWFPDQQEWVYHYTYTVPEIDGEDALAEELNHYFETSISEMTKLVLPMFAVDMPGEGNNSINDRYEITCNNSDFFSFVLHRSQSSPEQNILSLQSAVFAVSGQYAGESLTLRGLAREIGDSSSQISGYVLQDVWCQIERRMLQEDESIRPDMSFELLSSEFFPETNFYADESGNITFYLQPGLLGESSEIAVFTYTPQELENLLGL